MLGSTGQPTTIFGERLALPTNRRVLSICHHLFCGFELKDVLLEWVLMAAKYIQQLYILGHCYRLIIA